MVNHNLASDKKFKENVTGACVGYASSIEFSGDTSVVCGRKPEYPEEMQNRITPCKVKSSWEFLQDLKDTAGSSLFRDVSDTCGAGIQILMAENTNNGQERDQGHLLDKENQPNPLEQNQPKSASRMIQSPLQDSQLCNLTTNSEMRRIESTQDPIQTESGKLGDKRKSNWLTDMGKSLEEKMKEKNPEAKSSPGTKRKINTPKRSKSTSEKGPQSTVIKSDVKERKNFTAMPTEPKVSVSVSYRWINNGVECDTAGYNTPIIDFAKRTLEANPSLTKKSGYLQIHAQKLNAIVSPWAPCGALEQV
ncbi:uncharacterized protein LOC130267785 isoform X4 [Hyla sarda]|uniref:uncharacterized protein LOC130267785 isoform X4 n=1 Tax=Hyla sarda TaxID=327740 RepID=UPI0024C31E11|nr:uncharacterized protein LOC130267785 isoform X4 [Hyla sarda]